MDNIWKKLGLPLCIIIGGTLLMQFIASMHFPYDKVVLEIIYLASLFLFGLSLNPYKRKKNSGWVGKLMICLVIVTLFMYRMGYFDPSSVLPLIGMLGLTSNQLAVPLIFVLCGYLFYS